MPYPKPAADPGCSVTMSRASNEIVSGGDARGAPDDAARDRTARRFRPRLLPTLATIAVVAVCVAAGTWQRQRMHAKESLRAEFDAAMHADPISFANLPGDAEWAALRYRPVIATGEFLGSRQILVDNRVHAGRAGYHVVTPMALADGRVVLVNRGWIAQGASRSMLPAAPPPPGVVSVQGRVALPTGYLELQNEAAAGPVWQNLDPARIKAATGLAIVPAVVEVDSGSAPDDGLVRDWPAPDFGIETHRIYMVQWYVFALLAVVLWIAFNLPRSARADNG